MNDKEILKELESLGIIANIAGEYFITEKYKELLAPRVVSDLPPVKRKLNYDAILNSSTSGDEWPDGIGETVGRARAVLLMDACGVPALAPKGYRLRGLDKEVVNIIGNIVKDPNIHPPTFITAIKLYYKHTDMPKGFKNLVGDGDVLDIYNEHIAGDFVKNITPKDTNNQQCR